MRNILFILFIFNIFNLFADEIYFNYLPEVIHLKEQEVAVLKTADVIYCYDLKLNKITSQLKIEQFSKCGFLKNNNDGILYVYNMNSLPFRIAFYKIPNFENIYNIDLKENNYIDKIIFNGGYLWLIVQNGVYIRNEQYPTYHIEVFNTNEIQPNKILKKLSATGDLNEKFFNDYAQIVAYPSYDNSILYFFYKIKAGSDEGGSRLMFYKYNLKTNKYEEIFSGYFGSKYPEKIDYSVGKILICTYQRSIIFYDIEKNVIIAEYNYNFGSEYAKEEKILSDYIFTNNKGYFLKDEKDIELIKSYINFIPEWYKNSIYSFNNKELILYYFINNNLYRKKIAVKFK